MTAPLGAPLPLDRAACRILHLEDSAIDAELIAVHLARAGFGCEILLVGERESYTRALTEGAFDLILADYVLPDFDGLAALALARELAPETPFIFVSGTLGEEAAVEAVRLGATDYVVKQRLTRLPVATGRAMAEARSRAGQREAVAALRESEARLRLALDAGRLGAWELDLRTLVLKASATCLANFGRAPGSPFSYADLLAAVHPDDRARMQAAVARSVTERMDYDIEYRTVWPDGEMHWIQVRGRPVHAADGTPLGMAGVTLDVTERKLAEERQQLLSQEVDHRAKNALAVVQAALRLTRAADLPDYVRAIEGRIAAMARAQTLLAQDRWSGADLRTLIAGELAPFLGGDAARATVEGPALLLPARATQPLAMAFHELATNAVKYGAMSARAGRVRVSWHVEQRPDATMLRLEWRETGGPAIASPPDRQGFGGRVLDGTVRRQLGGKLSLSWEQAGLVCDIAVPLGAVLEPAGQGGEDA